MKRLLVMLLLVCGANVAHAYPQFQLAKDQTCSGCHLSPAGGGLLSDNGLAVADSMSELGTAPEFFYNKVKPPSWLVLGGDLRGAAGYVRQPQNEADAFPMQAEVYARAIFGAFSVHVTAGIRDPEHDDAAETIVWSREHYLQWQSDAGSSTGVFIRVGRFMPVFGLRFAEHEDYTRRYGGTQLYGEGYGVAAEVIEPKYEAHLTGYIKDPFLDTTEHSNGVTFYGEARPTETFSIGAESRYAITTDDRKFHVGGTAKWYVPQLDLLFQLEVQNIWQKIFGPGNAHADQLVGYLMATYFLPKGVMVDLGYGQYDEDVDVTGLDRNALDLNIHWFTTSHVELMLANRIEMLDGPDGAYSLLMLHYRL
jgi:hypothetical protein